jgi:hypothetical protein
MPDVVQHIREENRIYRIVYDGEMPVGEELISLKDLAVSDVFHMCALDGTPIDRGRCLLVMSDPFFTENEWCVGTREWSGVGPDTYVSPERVRALRTGFKDATTMRSKIWRWLKSFPVLVELSKYLKTRRMLASVKELKFTTVDQRIKSQDPDVNLPFPRYRHGRK